GDSFFVSRSGISGRVLSFVALAALLAAVNTYALTLATALFLPRVGAEALPIYYMLAAIVSIPVSIAFTEVIDRWRRPVIFTALLTGPGIITAIMVPMTAGDEPALFYALFLIVTVFEQLSYSIFYVLMADYFTPAETHASTTPLALGMALGGLIGGA